VIVATVVLEGPGTLGAALIRSVPEGVDDATRIEGEEETEELATGESVEESEVLGPVVVLLTVERNAFVEKYELTVYSTKGQTVRPVTTVKMVRPVATARTRTLPDLSRFERSELLMRVQQRPVPGSVSPRRSYQPPVCLLGT
jgi:hypothetical protein